MTRLYFQKDAFHSSLCYVMLCYIVLFYRFIGLCVYNVVIMCIVGVTVTLALPERDDIRYAFQAACIMFCAYSSLCMLFVPKVNIPKAGPTLGAVKPSWELFS